jgi:hypothetical protein
MRSRLLVPFERLVQALTDPARRERVVLAVLVAYAGTWTLYGAIAKSNRDIHYDTAELVAWSRELALGYPKHPPLATWIVRGWFALFPLTDLAFYLLAMISAIVALWFAWRLMGRFFDAEKRVLGLALLTFVPFYNFHALTFDHNTVLVPLWAAATYWFVCSFESRSVGWAALAGIGAAAAMLGKFWSIFLLSGLGFAALFDSRRGAYFRSPAPWVTILVGAAAIAPYFIWLVLNDFPPLKYAISTRASDSATAVASALQFAIGCLSYMALPFVLAVLAVRPDRAAVVDTVIPSATLSRFAAVAFWVPLLLPVLVAITVGLELSSIWATSAFSLLPVIVLSSPKVRVSHAAVVSVVRLAVLFPPLMMVSAPLIATLVHRKGLPLSAIHGSLLAQRMEKQWRATSDRPLRLVGGDLDLSYVTAFYLPDRPAALPLGEPQFAPWIDTQRIAREGIVLVCYSRDDLVGGRTCVHKPVIDRIEAIRARSPAGHRVEVEIIRTYLGVPGQAARYLIFTLPPQP